MSVSFTADDTVEGLTGSLNSTRINGVLLTPWIVLLKGIELIEMFFTVTVFGASGAGPGVSSFLQEKRKINTGKIHFIFLTLLFTDNLFDHISIDRMWQCHRLCCMSVYP